MADTGDNAKTKWTDEEKIKFLSMIVGQLMATGAKPTLEDIDLPGRTVKSMRHALEKAKKDAIGYGIPAGTPAKARGGKRKTAVGEDDEDADEKPAATPSKRPRTKGAAKVKKGGVKAEPEPEFDDSDDEA
ncbi:hypothetical protein GGR57DRAFT_496969 [Xylariaceae sp. FL1272]|nr:hypothetical protein GGR57DRAFT_496969 [Xylariaceae sp. FL1272]